MTGYKHVAPLCYAILLLVVALAGIAQVVAQDGDMMPCPKKEEGCDACLKVGCKWSPAAGCAESCPMDTSCYAMQCPVDAEICATFCPLPGTWDLNLGPNANFENSVQKVFRCVLGT